jgi:RNA polymerase sigma factor (sigma-70 family)
MVWRVCHAVLRQTEEAEDAFQATFLVLARKATSIRKTESLPSWLHGVAYRIAVSAQRASIRRIAREATLQPRSTTDPASEASWREVQALLHAEVERLPEKYRAPFVLCFLEGRSRAETARRLGLKQGTVWSRLAKARHRLQGRLARRGISLSAVLTAAAIADGEAPATVVSRLAQSVIQATLQYAAGKSLACALLSAKVIGLANGRMASMFLTKIKITLAVVIASAGIMSAGLFAHQGLAWCSSEEEPAQEQKPAIQQASLPNRSEQKVAAGQNPNGEGLPAGAQVRLGLDHFRRDGGAVSFLAFSKNGSSLYAAGTMDGTIHGWDAATGKELRKFRVFENRPIGGASKAISPDGTLVASADRNNITIWNLPSARQLRQIKLSTARASQQVVFTPDGKSLATLGSEDGNNEVNFWDIGTGKLLCSVRLQMPPTGAPRPDVRPQIPGFGGRQLPAQAILPRLTHLDFSPDGRVII